MRSGEQSAGTVAQGCAVQNYGSELFGAHAVSQLKQSLEVCQASRVLGSPEDLGPVDDVSVSAPMYVSTAELVSLHELTSHALSASAQERTSSDLAPVSANERT